MSDEKSADAGAPLPGTTATTPPVSADIPAGPTAEDIAVAEHAAPTPAGLTEEEAAAAAAEHAALTPVGKALRWFGVVAMLYLLICAIGVIGDGFKGLGSDTAKGLFEFATNPLIGLFVGVLATAIIQSSSTTTTLVVTAVGTGAVPISVAVPMIMGANIGTSVTNTLASLGHVGNRQEFRRAFAASTVHDFFNLMAVIILLPVEIFFHPLEKLSGWLAGNLQGTVLPDPKDADVIGKITKPIVANIGTKGLLGDIVSNSQVAGGLTIILGVAMIFLSVRYLGKLLQVLMVGTAKRVLERTVGGHPAVAMGAGLGVTALVQSSSVTTSMMVPFAGSGALTTRQIYPLTLGANVGTTITALIAAFAVTSDDAQLALQAALVHLLFNVVAICVIYVLPILRSAPVLAAEFLAALASEKKAYAAAWVITVFLAIPALGIFIYTLFA